MDDDEEALLPSQQAGIRKEEVEALVADVVRFLLFRNFQHPGVPLRREELSQLVTNTYKQRGLANTVLERAKIMLASVFGLELRELQKPRQQQHGRSSQGSSDIVREYVLKSTVSPELRGEYVHVEETAALEGLAIAMIGIIYLTGEKCPEENFWAHLQRLGVEENDEAHPVFGSIKLTLEELTKQRYIQREKIPPAEGDGYVYTLAEKALDSKVLNQVQEWISKLVQEQEDNAAALFASDEEKAEEEESRSEE